MRPSLRRRKELDELTALPNPGRLAWMRRGKGSFVRRLSLVSVLAASLSLVASPSPATASVTLGQVVANPDLFCSELRDRVQLNTSGNSYVVPNTGGVTAWTVSSWSSNAGTGAGQVKMKIYRPVPQTPDSYSVVGHEGPHNLPSNSLQTFPANIAVKAGDVLGLNTLSGDPHCATTASGDNYGRTPAGVDLADGQMASFNNLFADHRLNISAVINPTNTFTIGAVTRNKKKGTATLAFDLPNPGDLAGAGQGAQVASAGAVTSKAVPAGTATLVVKAKGKKRRKLNEKGKVKLNLAVTYPPTGGDPSTQSVKVKLKKRL